MGAAAVMEGDCTTAVAVTAGEAALANAACAGSNAGSCDCERSGDSCGSCCCSAGSAGAAVCGDAGCPRLNSDATSPCAAAADASRAAAEAASAHDTSPNASGPSLWRCSRGDALEGDEVDERSSDAVESAAAVSAAACEPHAARSSRASRRAIDGADGVDRLLRKASQPHVITVVGEEGETAAQDEEEENEESDDSSDGAKRRRQRLLTKLRKHPLFHDLQAALLHECLAAPRLPSALLCALPDDDHTSSSAFRNGSSGDCTIASPPSLPSSRRRSFETVSRAVLVAHVQVERDLAGLRPWTNRIGLVLEQSYRAAVAAAESERYAALLYNCHSEDCKRRINAYYDCERLVLAKWAQQHLARRRRDIGLASAVVAAPARSTEATAATPASFAAAAASAAVDASPSSSCTAAAAEGGAEAAAARSGALSLSGELEPAPSNPLNAAAAGSATFRTPTTSPQPAAALLAVAESAVALARRDNCAKANDDGTSGRMTGAGGPPPPPDDPQPLSPSVSFPLVCVAFDRAPTPTTTAAFVGRTASIPTRTGHDDEGEGRVLRALAAWHRSDDGCATGATAVVNGESGSSSRSSPQQPPPLQQQQQLLPDVPLDLSCKSIGAPYSSSSSRMNSSGSASASTGQAASAAGLPRCSHSGCADQCSAAGDAAAAAAAAEGIGSSGARRQRSPGRSGASGRRDQNADTFALRAASTESDRHWRRWATTPSQLGSIKDGGVKKHMLSKYSWDCVATRGDDDDDRHAADAATTPTLPPSPPAAAALHDRANRAALTAIVEPGNSPQSECSPSLAAANASVVAAVARLGGRSRATLDDVVAQCLSGQKQRKRRAAAAALLDQRPKQPMLQPPPQQVVQSPPQQQQPLQQLSAARRKAASAGACWVVNAAALAPGSAPAAATSVAMVGGAVSSSPSGVHAHQASAGEAIKCSGGAIVQQQQLPALASAAVKQEPTSVAAAAGLYGSAAADYLDLVGGWPAAVHDGTSVGSPGSTTSVLESLRRVVNSVSAKPSDGEKGGCCGVGSGGSRWHSASSILIQQQQQQLRQQQQQQHQLQLHQRTGAAVAAGGCEAAATTIAPARHTGGQHSTVGVPAGLPGPCAPSEVVKLPAASVAGQPAPAAAAAGCSSAASSSAASAAAAGSSCASQPGSKKTGEGSPQPLPVSQQQQTQQPTGKRYLSHHARLILNDWFLKHIRRPYPTLSEKILLAQQCGISSAKVDTWFANKRNRTHNTRKLLPKYSRLVLLKSAAGGGSGGGSAAVPSASAPLLAGPATAAAATAAATSDSHRLLSGQPLPAVPSL